MCNISNLKLADIGYFINLDSSIDRLDNINKQINHFNITNLHRFPALSDQHIQSSATKSHFAILEQCLKNNYETAFIAEDDFQLYDNLFIGPNSNSTSFINYLNNFTNHIKDYDWDIILLGFNPKKPCIPVSRYLTKVFRSTGGWAYLIKPKAIEYILNNFSYSRDYLAIDDIIPAMTYRNFLVYASNVQIVHHAPGFISTLQPSLGPTDYREWVNGNYYNYVWQYLSSFDSFELCLDQIYSNSDFERNNIIKLTNYNKIDQIFSFLPNHKEYRSCYMEVDNTTDSFLGYCISAEFNNLIHTSEHTKNIVGLGKNYLTVSLE